MTEQSLPEANDSSAATLSEAQRALVLQLHDAGAVKFGKFTLKSGVESPVYIDLRVTVSYPKLLRAVSSELRTAVANVDHDLLCGVPYTALPFATAMSLDFGKPMVMRRKEAKAHGTRKLIEGNWEKGQKCLIVEDLVTSGLSVMETVEPLKNEGMDVSDVVVLLDREQGARANLKAQGLNLHSVFSMSVVLDLLVSEGRVDGSVRDEMVKFLQDNQVSVRRPSDDVSQPKKNENGGVAGLTYAARAEKAACPAGKRLLELMDSKKTNLAVAADVTSKTQLLELAEKVGPEICMLKTHADIISDWDSGTGHALIEIAKRHHFMIFEDRKFADIGNTVINQVCGGVHAISTWADIINAHSVPGPGIIAGLAQAAEDAGGDRECGMGLVLLAEMSSKGNLPSGLPGYKEKTIEMAEAERKFVFGFISMGRIAGDDFVYLTPGVKMSSGGDDLGQQYATPHSVICRKGSDVIIVGRGIYKAADPAREAKLYRQAGWRAYEARCSGVE